MLTEPDRWLLRGFPTLVWYCGPDAPELSWVNDTWLEFTGRTLEEELGFGFLDGIHPDDRDQLVALFRDHFERREPYRVEYRMRHRDGDHRWIHELGSPITTPDGEFGGFLGSCYDVTERREVLDQLQASQALNELLMQTIFHDLAGPLGAAASALDLLHPHVDGDADAERLLALLSEQQVRMNDLLTELRHLDMAEHGEDGQREQRVTLAELIEELIDALELGDRTLHRALDHVEVEVDTLLLCRALENVLRNAVAHTSPDATIWVRCEAVDGFPLITIEDDGPGLPDDRESLFEAYRRGDTQGTSGLGLSIAQRYLHAIDGDITAADRPGGGARFVVELPSSALATV